MDFANVRGRLVNDRTLRQGPLKALIHSSRERGKYQDVEVGQRVRCSGWIAKFGKPCLFGVF